MNYSDTFKIIKDYHDLFWYYYGVAGFIPLVILLIYKFYFPLNYKKFHKYEEFPKLWTDTITKIFIMYSFFYYLFDLIFLIMIGNFTTCKISYMWHHTCSVIFLPFIVFNRYIPWFVVLTAVMHALLLMFPLYTNFNYIYLGSILLSVYGYFQPPFGLQKNYIYLRRTTLFAMNSLIPLWYFKCKNTFDN